MPTYLIAYEEALTKKIEAGGTQEEIDRAIKAYNSFHRSEFDTWLTDAKLECFLCGEPAVKDKIEPLDEVTCESHRRKESA